MTFSIESVNVFGNKNVIQFPDMTPSFHSLWKLTEYFHNISLIGLSTTPITFNIITLIDVIKCIMYVFDYCEENTAFEYNHVRVNDLHNTWKLCKLLITKVCSLSEDAIYAIYRRVYEKVSF